MDINSGVILAIVVIAVVYIFGLVVKRKSDNGNVLSSEENNFIRYYLCQKIATKAVRIFFRSKVPELTLASHLNNNNFKLRNGPGQVKCTPDQLQLLFPGGVVSSETFDFTLLYKLIRNTIPVEHLPMPTRGWGREPQIGDIKQADDIERIRCHRNKIAHNTDFEMHKTEFDLKWKDLSQAITRLSSNTLTREINSLLSKNFDKQDSHKITQEFLENVQQMKDDILLLQENVEEMRLGTEQDIVKMTKNVDDVREEVCKVNENVRSVTENIVGVTRKMTDVTDKIDCEMQRHIPTHIRMSHEQRLKSWRVENRIFYNDTSVCKASWEMVKLQKITIFIGSSGSGKTATSRHVALRLENEEGYEIVPVSEPDKILEYANINRKQVFVLDDILGKLCLDMSLYNIIERHKEGLLKGLGKNSKIIVTSRKTIFREAEKLNTYITENFIDFQAKENLFSENDKRQILQNHCKENNISEEDFKEISLRSADIMFPLLCKLFSTDIKYRKLGETFFNQPIKCLLEEIDKLEYASKSYYPALILCLVNGGEISWDTMPSQEIKTDIYNHCGINLGTSDGEIMKAMEKMTDTYLRRINKVYTFIHDSIEEVLAFHYGTKFPDQILKYMPSSFITNRVKVCQQSSTVGDFSIVLSSSQYSSFAERLYKDIESLELYNVFMNPALKHPAFLREFLKMLSLKPCNDVFDLLFSHKGNLKHINKHSEKFFEENTGEWNEYERQQILLNATHYKHDPDNGLQRIFFNNKLLDIRSDTRIISWVVYYGHTEILENIFNNATKNNKSINNLVGEDILEQSRLLSLACFSNSYDMVNLLLNHIKHESINSCFLDTLEEESIDSCFLDTLEEESINSCFSDTLEEESINSCFLDTLEEESINSCFSDTLEEESINLCFSLEEEIQANSHKLCLPTSAACQMGNINIVKLLMQNNGNFCLNIDGLTRHVLYVPLISAVRQGHFKVVQYIVTEQKERLSSEIKDVSLNVAVANGHYDITHLFVELGTKIKFCKFFNTHPLNLACINGHEKIVHYLMGLGADKNYCEEDGKSPILFASGCGHIEIVQFLIEKEADINHSDNSGNSPLLLAAGHGYLEIAKLLVGNGGNINHCDKDGNSPLIEASKGGHLEIVKLLVGNGENVNHCDKDGNSPLIEASNNENLDIIKMLVENGGIVNHKNKWENSPLFVTSCNGNCDIVKYLLEKGACINEHNRELVTPLSKAVQNKNLELSKILLGCGAVIKHDQETILCYATMSGMYELVDLILLNIDLSKDCLVDALPIALWEGHSNILQRLLSEGNKKGSFLGNLLLFDLITGIQKGTLPCQCNHLNIPYQNWVLLMLKYSGAMSRYRSITSFIMKCSEKSFSRLLKIGLDPNSIITHDNTDCPHTGVRLIQIMLADDVHGNIVDREEKVVRLLQNKVDLNCKCKNLRSIKYLIRGKVHYISVIEYARLQSCYEYNPYSFYPEMYYPMPFYFEMGIDNNDVLSEVVKDFRRKSV